HRVGGPGDPLRLDRRVPVDIERLEHEARAAAEPERLDEHPAEHRFVEGVAVVALGGVPAGAFAVLARMLEVVHRRAEGAHPGPFEGGREVVGEGRLARALRAVDRQEAAALAVEPGEFLHEGLQEFPAGGRERVPADHARSLVTLDGRWTGSSSNRYPRRTPAG